MDRDLVRLIRLNRRGDTPHYITFVSDEDYERARKHFWHARVVTSRHVYARTYMRSKGRHIHLHHFIIREEISEGYVVDHIDGNTLNNARENLRVVTKTENQLNSYKHRARKARRL